MDNSQDVGFLAVYFAPIPKRLDWKHVGGFVMEVEKEEDFLEMVHRIRTKVANIRVGAFLPGGLEVIAWFGEADSEAPGEGIRCVFLRVPMEHEAPDIVTAIAANENRWITGMVHGDIMHLYYVQGSEIVEEQTWNMGHEQMIEGKHLKVAVEMDKPMRTTH